MSGALDPAIQQEIIDRDLYAVAVLSGNRNFDGRIHPYAKQAFLASPPLVVATPSPAHPLRHREGRAGHRRRRQRPKSRLKDLWPSDAEIDAVVLAASSPNSSARCTRRCSTCASSTAAVPPAVRLARDEHLHPPPAVLGSALAGERTLRGMRPLAVLGDNITTDHLSPSNAILASSAAGEYLAKMGLPEEDFNPYATHRGDHLTAQRATFANPKLLQRDGARRRGQREAGFAGAGGARRRP